MEMKEQGTRGIKKMRENGKEDVESVNLSVSMYTPP